ncbi:hypothetical protein CUJ84_pRLN1001043 (plasmid) [Rhizobium leguminosarum]|uniref:Uncharacterized protein n=1 Tax=Rhizobium leguminosarum TaxID=384 RepID=A0A2K9ZE08_RHILE|nr:hypothetical protein CUJ84_pRLN1001043 [Rhizobium leguminosarum]
MIVMPPRPGINPAAVWRGDPLTVFVRKSVRSGAGQKCGEAGNAGNLDRLSQRPRCQGAGADE